MATGKKSFLLYCDYKATFQELSDSEAGKLIKHIFQYVTDENPELNNRMLKIAFEPIKQQLKRDLKIWEETLVKRSDAGKASAKKREQIKQVLTHVESVEHNSTNSTVSVNDNVNVIVNDNVNESVSEIQEITLTDFKVTPMIKKNILEMNQLHSLWSKISKLNPEDTRCELINFLDEKMALEKKYKNLDDLKSHITNWFKTNNFNKNTQNTQHNGTTRKPITTIERTANAVDTVINQRRNAAGMGNGQD
jgi:hypothetical protein